MKILIPLSILCLIYSCSMVSSKSRPVRSGNQTRELIPKDTLFACIREASDIINSGNFKAADFLSIFKKRASAFKVETVYMPAAANYDTAQDVIHVFINPSTSRSDSNFCFVEITNLPLIIAEKNDFISLQDIENKFGPGKPIPWDSNQGLQPPKEYRSPVRFTMPHQPNISRSAYLSVISDRPDDKEYKGILYFSLCY